VDAVGQDADPALRRFDVDLDEALVERRHVGVEGGREPLGLERPAPEAPRPPPGRPFPSRCHRLDLGDDRRRVRVVRPLGRHRPDRPRPAFWRPRGCPSDSRARSAPPPPGSMGDGPHWACSADPPYGHNRSARVKCACSGAGRNRGLRGQQSSGESRSILECRASAMI
jgi:hypothetical protein